MRRPRLTPAVLDSLAIVLTGIAATPGNRIGLDYIAALVSYEQSTEGVARRLERARKVRECRA